MRQKNGFKLKHVLGLAVVAFLVNGCMEPGDGVGMQQNGMPLNSAYFKSQVLPILNQNCEACHSAPFGMGYGATGLTIEADSAYDMLVNKLSTQMEPNSLPPIMRVKPGSLTESYLYQKLISETPLTGSRMPLGQPMLSQDQLDVIKTWILAGAPR